MEGWELTCGTESTVLLQPWKPRKFRDQHEVTIKEAQIDLSCVFAIHSFAFHCHETSRAMDHETKLQEL